MTLKGNIILSFLFTYNNNNDNNDDNNDNDDNNNIAFHGTFGTDIIKD